MRPTNVLIDGGQLQHILSCILSALTHPYLLLPAIVQTSDQSFDFNGESDLDLEYAMGLTNPQPITLLQTGDDVEGELLYITVI